MVATHNAREESASSDTEVSVTAPPSTGTYLCLKLELPWDLVPRVNTFHLFIYLLIYFLLKQGVFVLLDLQRKES